jgi:hypothetical protein
MLSKHYVSEAKLFRAAKMVFTKFATREVPDADILRQIPNVLKGSDVQILSGSARGDSYKKWPLADIRKMESILADGVTLSVLRAKSPFVLGEIVPSARYILDTLFPRDPLLCCGLETKKVVTHPRSVWGYPGYLQFIVPSPMSKAFGLNKAGKQSHRCLDNTGPRRFLVVEFDFKADVEACAASIARGLSGASKKQLNELEKAKFVRGCLERDLLVQDICAALIDHLSKLVKPALVVHSGGKSLHAWFYCGGVDEAPLREFMEYAVSLGADRATWPQCQLVRMPGGTRYLNTMDTVPQTVCYFDPEVIEA